jgi:hypothetical protein
MGQGAQGILLQGQKQGFPGRYRKGVLEEMFLLHNSSCYQSSCFWLKIISALRSLMT